MLTATILLHCTQRPHAWKGGGREGKEDGEGRREEGINGREDEGDEGEREKGKERDKEEGGMEERREGRKGGRERGKGQEGRGNKDKKGEMNAEQRQQIGAMYKHHPNIPTSVFLQTHSVLEVVLTTRLCSCQQRPYHHPVLKPVQCDPHFVSHYLQ